LLWHPVIYSSSSPVISTFSALVSIRLQCFLAVVNMLNVDVRHNVIPIVMGARPEDYAALAPPGSYIHVSNFSGPQELAQYLKLLAANPDLYNKYFEWKKTWSQIDIRYWCRLCMMLHLREDIGYFAWFEDYHLWWNSVCGTSSLYCSSFVTLVNVVITLLAVNRLFCHRCME